MTRTSRFVALTISIMTAFALGACQPKSDNNETIAETAATQSIVETPATEMSTGEVTVANDAITNATNSNVDMVKLTEDYSKAMIRMNDEIIIGLGYNAPDTAFAKSMLGFYRGAITMAELQLKYGTDKEMRLLAQEIIDSHTQKLGVMNKWLASHPDIANPKPNIVAMQQGYADIVSSMNYRIRLGINALDADLAFARAMLPHQLATVAIAKEQLRYGTDEEMRRLAVQISKKQPLFIEPLQAWLGVNDSAPVDVNFEEESFEKNSFEKEESQLESDIASESAATS